MYKSILIASDGSELADKAVSQGLGLAKELGASVIAVTVTETWLVQEMAAEVESGHTNPIADYEEKEKTWAQKILAGISETARTMGVACQTVHVRDRHPADGIVETADSKHCDLIVMASHGRRGFDRLLLGSQTLKALAHTKRPVLVVR
jgi:nucleotide-binding universal stress UspA family protein